MPGGDCRAATPGPHHQGGEPTADQAFSAPRPSDKAPCCRLLSSPNLTSGVKPRRAPCAKTSHKHRCSAGEASCDHAAWICIHRAWGRVQIQRKNADWELQPRFPGSSHVSLPAALFLGVQPQAAGAWRQGACSKQQLPGKMHHASLIEHIQPGTQGQKGHPLY